MGRSRDRVKKIDETIRKDYRTHGPEYVASELGEDVKYIIDRAKYLRVSQGIRERNPDAPKIERYKAKVKDLMIRMDKLKQELYIEKDKNKEIREELIIVTHKYKKLKESGNAKKNAVV